MELPVAACPGTPKPSGAPESFLDTPVVNGMAYPTVTVPQGAYRFRILNAANDRMFNSRCSMPRIAAMCASPPMPGANLGERASATGLHCTEVKMVPRFRTRRSFTELALPPADGPPTRDDTNPLAYAELRAKTFTAA